MQNKHSEQIEKNYFGICRPPLRAFQQTCGFSEELQRPSLHQQVSSNFTCDLKATVNSLGTSPQTGPAYTKIRLYVFLRDDLAQHQTIEAYILTMSALSRIHRSQLNHAWELLPLCSRVLCLPPYFQLLFLQQLFTLKLQGLLGDASCTDPEENGTGSRRKGLWKVSQPCPLPQNKAFNTAIAADRCLLLTDLHLWNSYHWLPTHLFSDSLPFFYYYLGLEETTTHPSYNLSPIYHMISNSVLSLHPHKCLLPHFQGISHTTLHGTFLPYVQCLKLHLQSKGLS